MQTNSLGNENLSMNLNAYCFNTQVFHYGIHLCIDYKGLFVFYICSLIGKAVFFFLCIKQIPFSHCSEIIAL